MMKKYLVAIPMLALSVAAAVAQKVEMYSTTEASLWQEVKNVKWTTKAPEAGKPVVTLTDERAQTIDGIGGTFNEIGWDMLCYLSEDQRQQILNDLFSEEGAKFSYCRMPIGASDYGMNFYSLNDVVDDFDMVNFSIARDRHILLRYIKEAQKINPDLKMWASPWSPPGWMKINSSYASGYDRSEHNHNGLTLDRHIELPCTGFKMQEGYLKAYALYLAKFCKAYEEQGVHIENINIQNEPCSNHIFPSCPWRPEDMAYFVGRFLGPRFEQDSIDTEIIFGTINRDNPAFTRTALNDPEAAKYFKGAGFQWDGKGAIPYISKEYPHLKMMHTEAECGNGSNDWGAAEHTWWQISHYLRNGARNFTYWNMVLDDTGTSPWGWKQNSLISVNPKTLEVVYHPEYYLMKHLSHYVEPGAQRLVLDNADDDILAFVNPDGKGVVIVANCADKSRQVVLRQGKKYLTVVLQPKSFSTIYY
ncbi:MAG: glycoside hydrolase family 30 beta sandwich domain-containing protein [Bacteroidales bacterium]|nr:glycoside hydrolase family 30 beta sandwich domain-containing protein [Bacteroidales bacterium]